MNKSITTRMSLKALQRKFPVGAIVTASDPRDWRGPQAGVVLGHSVAFGPAVRVAHFGPLWDGRRSTAPDRFDFYYNEGIDYGPEDTVERYAAADFEPEAVAS